MLAIAAVVIGAALVAQRFMVSEPVAQHEEPRPATGALGGSKTPTREVEALAPVPQHKASLTVAPTDPSPPSVVPVVSVEPPAPSNQGSSNPAVSISASAATPPAAPATVVPRRSSPPLPTHAPAPQRPATAEIKLAQASVPAPARTVSVDAPRSKALDIDDTEGALSSPPEASRAADAPKVSSSPAAPAESTPAKDTLRAPRPFEAQQAQQQLGVAAWKASTCGHRGPTRGSGQVNVRIESWGRVVRVTHLNQAFVGTAVGVCVMEAFQQIQVPPFDGASQTLTGSFLIQ